MCTALGFKTKDFYFGRTLDYEFSYGEEIVITPRKFNFNFRNIGVMAMHYAIIGVAHIADNYPLYYDAVNEKGLSVAALNFVGNAHYFDIVDNKNNIAQFEFIPWVLSQCGTVEQARGLLEKINIVNTSFSDTLPPAQLHWLIADKYEAITVESVKEGLKIYDNPVGVLTNNPPFNEQMFGLNNYMHLSTKAPKNNFSKKLKLHPYSRGMGALGLPGDLSSPSRFVRVAFAKMNSVCEVGEAESVNQFFHIMSTVNQTRGCCEVADGKYEITIYTSCCNTDKGVYYYTTYDNHQITAVNMNKINLNGDLLIRYPFVSKEQIKLQN